MRSAITEKILPELGSADARRTAGIVLASIDELMKRETVRPEALAAAIGKGIDVARRLVARLGEAGMAPDAALLQQLDAFAATCKTQSAPEALRRNCQSVEDILEAMMLPALERLMVADTDGHDLAEMLREAGEWKKGLAELQLTPLPAEATESTASLPLTAEGLRDFLRTCLPNEPDIAVTDFVPLTGGMTKQTFRFKLKRQDGSIEALVARKSPLVPLFDVSCFHAHKEFDFTRAVFAQGYPMPEPLWLARDWSGVSGDFCIMRKVEGSNTGGLFSNSEITERVMLDMAEALAQLHRMPLEGFRSFIEKHKEVGLFTDTASQSTRRYLNNLIGAWKQIKKQSNPAEVFLLGWALANIPENDGPPVPLHGDFTPHNCLWQDGRLTAVLDWECGDFGDPTIDLAYVRPHIASRMDWEKFLQHYEQHAGHTINRDSLGYYAGFLDIRGLIACNSATTRIDHRETDDIITLNIDYEYAPMYVKMCMDRTA